MAVPGEPVNRGPGQGTAMAAIIDDEGDEIAGGLRELRALLPREWRAAEAVATGFARRIEFLGWDERAEILDGFFWGEARARLDKDQVTAVVNRTAPDRALTAATMAYARYCRAVVSATLLTLGEPPLVREASAALAHYFSLLAGHQEAAVDWIGLGRHDRVARALERLPGHAFLLLALNPDDSAESFIARDAFFAATHGRKAA